MKTLNMTFNSPPFSLNSSHYRNGNRTKECRAWGDALFQQLEPYKNEIIEFMHNFNPLKQAFHVEYTFCIPKLKFFTKQGKISRRSFDLSNVEKLLTDIIFDPRFYKRGVTNLNADDTLVIKQVSQKECSPSDSHLIQITIQIVPNGYGG